MPNFMNGKIQLVHYHLKGYQAGNLNLVSQQYTAWPDCTDVQAGLAIYWWQRLIIFVVVRIRVNMVLCTSCAMGVGNNFISK